MTPFDYVTAIILVCVIIFCVRTVSLTKRIAETHRCELLERIDASRFAATNLLTSLENRVEMNGKRVDIIDGKLSIEIQHGKRNEDAVVKQLNEIFARIGELDSRPSIDISKEIDARVHAFRTRLEMLEQRTGATK